MAIVLDGTTGITAQAIDLTTPLVVADGGTGLSAVGTSGNVLTSNGSAWTSTAPAAGTTFSAGTTGFTPNTATSGAVTLAGTLAVANGGTGLSAAGTSGNVLTSNGSAWASTAPVAPVAPVSLGRGQTWQNLLSSRAINTTYYNTTGNPIKVAIWWTGLPGNSSNYLYIDGVTVVRWQSIYFEGGKMMMQEIIPVGASYSITTASVQNWFELR